MLGPSRCHSARRALPAGGLAGELRDAADALDAFDGGDPTTDVRAVFSWSYRALSPAAGRMFRLLGLHPGPDIAVPAVASLAGVSLREARALLTELTRTHLVIEHAPGRYAIHDLLRVYATELTHDLDSDGERRAAVRRVLDSYLHIAYAGARLLQPFRDPIDLGIVHSGVAAVAPTDAGQAMAWFMAEHPVLLNAVSRAAEDGLYAHAWRLAWTMADFFDRKGHWQDWATTHETALTAADLLADRWAAASVRRGLGRARALNSVGWQYAQLRDHGAALRHCRRALHLVREVGDRFGEANTWDSIGYAHHHLGDYQQATACYQRAVELFRDLGDRYYEADTLTHAGESHQAAGDPEAALLAWLRALDILGALGHSDADRLRVMLRHHPLAHPSGTACRHPGLV